MNTIYLGDCLNVLRESVPDESIDLVYIELHLRISVY